MKMGYNKHELAKQKLQKQYLDETRGDEGKKHYMLSALSRWGQSHDVKRSQVILSPIRSLRE